MQCKILAQKHSECHSTTGVFASAAKGDSMTSAWARAVKRAAITDFRRVLMLADGDCLLLSFLPFSETTTTTDMTASLNETRQMIAPSPWVVRYMAHIPPAGGVLDLACGGGRHASLLAEHGYQVLAVDRNAVALDGLQGVAGVTTAQLDLEGESWSLAGQQFAGIVVTNYLWRPRLPELLALLAPGGVLIYETFMLGNEVFGKPSNPDFLLRPGELREVVATAGLREIAFEEGFVASPKPAMSQAVCAVRAA